MLTHTKAALVLFPMFPAVSITECMKMLREIYSMSITQVRAQIYSQVCFTNFHIFIPFHVHYFMLQAVFYFFVYVYIQCMIVFKNKSWVS